MRCIAAVAVVAACGVGTASAGADAPLEDVVVYQCARMKAPPRIDGRLDERAWAHVPVEPVPYKFLAQTPQPAGSRSEFRVGFDDRCLYLGAVFYRTDNAPLKQDHLGHDDPDLWMDDSTEIYIDTRCDGQFYKLIVNTLGVVTDFQQTSGGIDYSWEATGASVAAAVTDKHWTVEMAVPWRAMGMTGPPQRLIGFEVLRFSGPRDVWSSWTVGGSYGHPEKFGYLSFGGGVMHQIRMLARSVEASKGSSWQIVTSRGVLQYRSLDRTLSGALDHARAQVLTADMDIRSVPDPATQQRLAKQLKPIEASLADLEQAASAAPLTGSLLRSMAMKLGAIVGQARRLSFDARIAELVADAHK